MAIGKPQSLLEGLCGHALSFGAESIEVRRENDQRWRVWANQATERFSIFKCAPSSRDAKELLENLDAALKKPVRAVFGGRVFLLKARTDDTRAFFVSIEMAPKVDPSAPPKFTAKQGQYLAYIHSYTKLHRYPPAESDLQQYFRVSAPSIHEMIKTLERNGLIEKIPGQARSIRLCVDPEKLPTLE